MLVLTLLFAALQMGATKTSSKLHRGIRPEACTRGNPGVLFCLPSKPQQQHNFPCCMQGRKWHGWSSSVPELDRPSQVCGWCPGLGREKPFCGLEYDMNRSSTTNFPSPAMQECATSNFGATRGTKWSLPNQVCYSSTPEIGSSLGVLITPPTPFCACSSTTDATYLRGSTAARESRPLSAEAAGGRARSRSSRDKGSKNSHSVTARQRLQTEKNRIRRGLSERLSARLRSASSTRRGGATKLKASQIPLCVVCCVCVCVLDWLF